MNDILHTDSLFSNDQIENETELIPLITAEDEEQMNAETHSARAAHSALAQHRSVPGCRHPDHGGP
jgi:hypothetical protein